MKLKEEHIIEDETVSKQANNTDVFLWANKLVEVKEELNIELFLFSKNMVVYRMQINKDLRQSLESLFIDNLLEAVLDGVEQGMLVRDFEDAEAEKNVLQKTRLSKVENAKMVLDWVKAQENEIENFVAEEHDLKRIKGVLARCSHSSLRHPFFVIKSLPQSMVMNGKDGWMMRAGKFVKFDAEGALRIPADNQLLIIEQDIFVFNPAKLSSLFGYDAKKYSIAEAKLKMFSQYFKFSVSEDQTIEQMVKGQKTLVNKLQKIDPTKIQQAELVKYAEDLDLPLMVDDNGAIIIMDTKDLTMFINLLNEDYMESTLSGERYLISSKKLLKPPTDVELLKQYS